jgi:polyribonucleotide nucleotidyltransferase
LNVTRALKLIQRQLEKQEEPVKIEESKSTFDDDELEKKIQQFITDKMLPRLTKKYKQSLDKRMKKYYTKAVDECEEKVRDHIKQEKLSNSNDRSNDHEIKQLNDKIAAQAEKIALLESDLGSVRNNTLQDMKHLDEKYSKGLLEVCYNLFKKLICTAS